MAGATLDESQSHEPDQHDRRVATSRWPAAAILRERAAMKVPLDHEPFEAVALTRDQEQQLRWVADTVVNETLAEYDDFVHTNARLLDRKSWKHVLSRESVAVYKRQGPGDLGGITPDVTLHRPHLEPRSCRWSAPKILGVGTISGSIEDLLYGMIAPTKLDSEVRTSYIKDECGDTRVLANIIRPTEAVPLRSLLLRWSLYEHAANKWGVSARDRVNIEAIGTRCLPSGERIGYILVHSVDVPGCGELHHLGVIRSKISSCFILKDCGNGSVEIYMRGYVEPGGNMSESMAVFIGSAGLVSTHRLMLCGQSKKLAWMMRTRSNQEEEAARDNKSCALCFKNTGGLRSSVPCDVCLKFMCSRCVDKRKITHVRTNGRLSRVMTRVCKSCLTTASKTNASEVAVSEFVTSSNEVTMQNPLLYRDDDDTLSLSSPVLGGWGNHHGPVKTNALGNPLGFSMTRMDSGDTTESSDAISPVFGTWSGVRGPARHRSERGSSYSGSSRSRRSSIHEELSGSSVPPAHAPSSFNSEPLSPMLGAWGGHRGPVSRSQGTHSTPSSFAYSYDDRKYSFDDSEVDELDDRELSDGGALSTEDLRSSTSTRGRRSLLSHNGTPYKFDESQSSMDPEQRDLWIRMNQLRVAAEETYLLTRHNANVMLESQCSTVPERAPHVRVRERDIM